MSGTISNRWRPKSCRRKYIITAKVKKERISPQATADDAIGCRCRRKIKAMDEAGQRRADLSGDDEPQLDGGFRLSATLTEPIDEDIASGAKRTLRRLLVSYRQKGLFWFYLDHAEHDPKIRRTSAIPLASASSGGFCAFVTIKPRAVGFSMCLPTARAGWSFYGRLLPVSACAAGRIPRSERFSIVRSRQTAEAEDSLQPNSEPSRSRSEPKHHISGTDERSGFAYISSPAPWIRTSCCRKLTKGVTITGISPR